MEGKHGESLKKSAGKTESWWFCEDHDCKKRLAKVVKMNDEAGLLFSPDILEIEGSQGETFKVSFKFISISCVHCGRENHLWRGVPLSAEWDKNVREFNEARSQYENEDDILEEFAKNSFKRKLLLYWLSEKQQKLFSYVTRHTDDAWSFATASSELNLPQEDIVKQFEAIYATCASVDAELRRRASGKNMAWIEEHQGKIKRIVNPE